MKIGYDAKRLFRNYTGLGNYSRTLVANFKQFFEDEEIELFAEKTSENEAALEFFSDKYRIIQPSGRKFLWRNHGICKDIKKRGVEVYHGLSHELPLGIRKTGARAVVTIHDVCYKTFPGMFSWVERAIYSLKYPYALRNADKIIAISESTKQDILKYFPRTDPQKIEVVYQAIHPEFYTECDIVEARNIADKYSIAQDFILYVGSTNSRKNLLSVIKAMGAMPESERVQLVVVGGGSKYMDKCLRTAEELGILGLINHIEGMSSMRSLHMLYSLARCMVYPSFAEGFGLPVTEAVLSGCPVVTSNCSSLPEAGGTYAQYVDPNSVEEITTAITKALKMTPEERLELTKKARTEALKKFNPQTLTEQLHTLYKNLGK